MHEQAKLDEAAYFIGGMKREQERHAETSFRYELSAFTSAARSVLQYAHTQAEQKGQQAWYDKAVDNPRIRFFRCVRNLNIHSRPVVPSRSTAVNVHAVPATAGEPPPGTPREGRVDVSTHFFLSEWGGDEDAVTLAEKYLTDLQAVIEKGWAEGVITP
jgi:hypothetical protein